MRAGTMRNVIKVQYPIETRDTVGQPIPAWATLFTARASIEPLSEREYLTAQQVGTEATFRVKMRARPATETRISGKMRIIYGPRTFEIIGPDGKGVPGKQRETSLLCREVF